MSLIQLAQKYKTDKLEHGYIPFYEKYLPETPKRILEIGVKEGRSLAMWAEYFPDAEIHGLDLFEEYSPHNIFDYIIEKDAKFPRNIFLHKGNQIDYNQLEILRRYDFDVIIDDGSHNSRDQMMTFFGLFNGKHYFIEDLHCCDEEFYKQGIHDEFTAKNMFGTLGAHDSEYGDGDIFVFDKEYKIVCIHAHNDK